jgi:hypothetical protein
MCVVTEPAPLTAVTAARVATARRATPVGAQCISPQSQQQRASHNGQLHSAHACMAWRVCTWLPQGKQTPVDDAGLSRLATPPAVCCCVSEVQTHVATSRLAHPKRTGRRKRTRARAQPAHASCQNTRHAPMRTTVRLAARSPLHCEGRSIKVAAGKPALHSPCCSQGAQGSPGGCTRHASRRFSS